MNQSARAVALDDVGVEVLDFAAADRGEEIAEIVAAGAERDVGLGQRLTFRFAFWIETKFCSLVRQPMSGDSPAFEVQNVVATVVRRGVRFRFQSANLED